MRNGFFHYTNGRKSRIKVFPLELGQNLKGRVYAMNKRILSSLIWGLFAAIVSIVIFFLIENESLSISLIIGINTFLIMFVGTKNAKAK